MTREEWLASQKYSRSLFNRTKSSFWTEKVESERTNYRQLWRSSNILIGNTSTKTDSGRTAEEFATFFEDKVNDIRQAIHSVSISMIKASTIQNQLTLLSAASVEEVICLTAI